MEGTMLVHINPKLEGKNLMGAKDASGKLFQAEITNGVKTSPAGNWVEYQWVKPGETNPSKKVSYTEAVPNTKVYAGAGVWDVTLEEIKKAGF
jgi:methyl-accepting chemotaxis protein